MKHLRLFPIILLFLSLSLPLNAQRQSGKILGKGQNIPGIVLSAPKGGWTMDRMVLVAGTVDDATINPITVNINGSRYLLRTTGGSFSRKFPVSSGKNTIIVSGTNAAGTGKAQRKIYAKIPPVPLMLVLTSDTDNVYTDLHVYEPKPELSDPVIESKDSNVHVFWAQTTSQSGAKFYLNEQPGSFDQPGFGPYLYSHTSPPLGIYRVDANYWPSGDKAHTLSTLNIMLFGGTPNEQRKTIKSPLVMPGETTTLAWIRIDKNQKAYVYSPLLDKKPLDNSIWPKWVLESNPRTTTSSYDYY